jgi:hypothetical protein
VYPLLRQHLADNVDQVVAYLLLYHESAVANLLEVGRRALCGGRGGAGVPGRCMHAPGGLLAARPRSGCRPLSGWGR